MTLPRRAPIELPIDPIVRERSRPDSAERRRRRASRTPAARTHDTSRGKGFALESSREVELVHAKAAERPSASEARSRCHRAHTESRNIARLSFVVAIASLRRRAVSPRVASPARRSRRSVTSLTIFSRRSSGANFATKTRKRDDRRHISPRVAAPTARRTTARVSTALGREDGHHGGERGGRPRG